MRAYLSRCSLRPPGQRKRGKEEIKTFPFPGPVPSLYRDNDGMNSKLPTEIPVQWSKGVATSLVNKNWIFICPVICIIIRYLLKPFIHAKLQMDNYYGEIITEYLTNYMCFIVLSVESFSILFTFGVVKSVVVLLFLDTAIFIGLLVVGLVKMDLRGKEVL